MLGLGIATVFTYVVSMGMSVGEFAEEMSYTQFTFSNQKRIYISKLLRITGQMSAFDRGYLFLTHSFGVN